MVVHSVQRSLLPVARSARSGLTGLLDVLCRSRSHCALDVQKRTGVRLFLHTDTSPSVAKASVMLMAIGRWVRLLQLSLELKVGRGAPRKDSSIRLQALPVVLAKNNRGKPLAVSGKGWH